MTNRKVKSWKADGCRGRFYVRGKKNIIWYETNRRPQSLKLAYSPGNRLAAADIVRRSEQPGIYDDTSPVLLSQAFTIFMQKRCKSLERKTKLKYLSMYKNFISNDFYLSEPWTIKENIWENLNKNKNAPRTLNKYLIQLKTFNQYCIVNNWTDELFFDKDMKLKETEKIIEVWSDDELEILLNYFPERDKIFHIFLNLLYRTGFRVMEMALLTPKQILIGDRRQATGDREELKVERQDRKYRNEIILWKNKAGTKADYFPLAQPLIDLFNQLEFPDDENTSIFGYNLDRVTYYRKVLDACLKAKGIPKHTTNDTTGRGRSYHTFRKTKITHWLFRDKLSPAIVSKLSRDAIKTIMRYYAAYETEDFKKYV